MDYAVDAVLTADRAIFELFNQLEIYPHVIVGHSSGEIMALEAAGAIELSGEAERMQHILAGNEMIRGFFTEDAIPEAFLIAAGGADRKVITEVAQKIEGKLFITMDNCPHQVVICCGSDVLDRITHNLRGAGVICQVLPFARPYHTPLFEPGRKSLEEFFGRVKILTPKVEMYSCMTAKPMPHDPAEVRKLAVGQWAALVRFRETIESMYEAGVRLFVEIGPRGNLTGFVRDTLKGQAHLAVASNVHHRSGTIQLNHALGLLAAHGVPMDLNPLYNHRSPRTLDLDDADKGQKEHGAEKGAIKLSLGLPLPRLEGLKELLMAIPHPNQDGDGAQRKKQMSAPRMKPAQGSDQDIDSQRPGAAGPAKPFSPLENVSMHGRGPYDPQVMQEYFNTMELYLDAQEEVIKTYLERTGSTSIGREAWQPTDLFMASSGDQASGASDITNMSIEHVDTDHTSQTQGLESSPTSMGSTPRSRETIEELLLSLVSERTGYPTEMLEPDQNLEADLGIDSIKRVEILGAMVKHLGSFEESRLEQLNRLKTLREIVDYLTEDSNEGDFSYDPPSAETAEVDQDPAQYENLPNAKDISTMPFKGKTLHLVPGKEITVVRSLDLEEDLYLKHHTLGGNVSQVDPELLALPVLPFTMALEMMAEIASQLFAKKVLLRMKDLRTHNWIILEGQRLWLEINAKAAPDLPEAHVQLLVSDSSQTHPQLAVEGVFLFGDGYPEAPAIEAFQLQQESTGSMAPEHFYPSALYHGPSFQSVSTLNRYGINGVEAALRIPPQNRLFRSISNPQFFSDPLLLDGAGQAIGLWAANNFKHNYVIFPVGLTEALFYAAPADQPLRATCQAHTTLEGDTYVRSNIDLVNTDGSLRAQLIGLQHKRINMPEKLHLFRGSRDVMLSAPWPAPIEQFESSEMMMCCRFNPMGMNFSGTEGYVLRAVVANIILSRRERTIWKELPSSEMHRTEWLLARVAGKEAVRLLLRNRYGMEVWTADIEILEDNYGKPLVRGEWISQIGSAPSISLAHYKDMAIALAVDGAEILRCGIAMGERIDFIIGWL
jgi:malonyl CoA-acyl carrier protein transacylase/phosphopantetheinyl transferase (holo-ACP synthase)